MAMLDIVRTLLRRWWVLVAAAVLGAGLVAAPTPAMIAAEDSGPATARFGFSTADAPLFGLPADRVTRAGYGGAAGLALGLVGAAAIRPRRHARLRTRRDLERAYDAPVLAEVPRIPGGARYEGYAAVAARPSGSAAESYRMLRTAVLNLPTPANRTGEQAGRIVAVTSPRRGDGRSSVVTNLAAAIAEAGRSVLIVDCDFGHPTAHFAIGIHPGTGLSDLLAADDPGAGLAEVVQHSGTPGVAVLSIGRRGGRSPGAMATRLPRILAVATRMVDVVVIDAGPLLAAADAMDPVDLADAVVVTARRGRTGRTAAAQTAQILARCRARVAGVVLIGVGRDRDTGTAYLVPAVGPRPADAVPAGRSSVPPMNPVGLGRPVGVAG
ncbi:MAG: CpsD/CapB family tyrosine-protein kinase [Sporichthyaceae bacterium]